MNAEERLQFYLRRIEAEQVRKDSLDNSLNMPFYFLSFIAAGLGFSGLQIRDWDQARGLFFIVLLILLAISAVCFLVAATYFIFSFWGTSYKDLPMPAQYELELEKQRLENPDLSEKDLDAIFDSWLVGKACKVGTANLAANAQRAKARRHIANPAIAAAGVLAAAWLLMVLLWSGII